MSDFRLPSPPDNAEYWGFAPQKETLYGSDCRPRRFIRVIDALPGGSSRVFHSYQDEAGNPDSFVVVETVSIDTFIDFATFGHTPYIEFSLSGLKGTLDLSANKDLFLSQATLRNYEQRARTLLGIADEKKLSISSLTGSDSSKALFDELSGTLAMWEMLMNTGTMNPLNCLTYLPDGTGNVKSMRDKFDELEQRMLMSNFSPLPFKISQSDRERIKAAFH